MSACTVSSGLSALLLVVVVEIVVVGDDGAVIERRFENHPTAKVVAVLYSIPVAVFKVSLINWTLARSPLKTHGFGDAILYPS